MSNTTEMRKKQLRFASLMLLIPAFFVLSAFVWPLVSPNDAFPLHSMRDVPNFPGTVFVVVVSTLAVAFLVALPGWANEDRLSFLCGFLLGLSFLFYSASLGPTVVFYGSAIGSLYRAKNQLKGLTPHSTGLPPAAR